MSVTTYTDTFYDVRKGIYVSRAECYYLWNNFKSKTVNITFRRRKTIADNFISETYTLSTFPNREIEKHG